MNPNDSAFPKLEKLDAVGIGNSSNYVPRVSGGLTKRELLAAMAMQAIIGNSRILEALATGELALVEEVAQKSVMYADALIKELSK